MPSLPIAMLEKATLVAQAICELDRIESYGSMPHWEDYPELAQQELIAFVIAMFEGKTPETHQESWVVDQLLSGWTFGEQYDAVAKTDPRLMHWRDYPDAKRAQLTRAATLAKLLQNI
jgi:hypothetical protein